MSKYSYLYQKTLAECISLLDKSNDLEQNQITIVVNIGQTIDNLLTEATDQLTAVTKLARDLSVQRRKIVTPAELSSYRQLYLNFNRLEDIMAETSVICGDMTVEKLLAVTEKSPQHDAEETKSNDLSRSIHRLMNGLTRYYEKVESILRDIDLSDEQRIALRNSLELLRDSNQRILTFIENYEGSSQLRLFASHRERSKAA